MPDVKTLVDFAVEAEIGREFRILQITDTQIIDPGQSRYPERINNVTPLSDEQLYADCFYYIEKAIETAKPDLILMTGDNVYGEFDDSGASLKKLIAFMEGFQIPWAPVWGNHDNECKKGVSWQCQQFEEAEYCLFKRGDVTGNSNYTIGIYRGDQLKKVIYMMDSNGCGNGKSYSYLPGYEAYNLDEKIVTQMGFGKDQLLWLDETCTRITDDLGYAPSKFAVFHMPLWGGWETADEVGYPEGVSPEELAITELKNVDYSPEDQHFGLISALCFRRLLGKHRFDGVFAGHCHLINSSILHDGILFTLGTKTGKYDSHRPNQLGGTLITLPGCDKSFRVDHIYIPDFTK